MSSFMTTTAFLAIFGPVVILVASLATCGALAAVPVVSVVTSLATGRTFAAIPRMLFVAGFAARRTLAAIPLMKAKSAFEAHVKREVWNYGLRRSIEVWCDLLRDFPNPVPV